MTNAEISRVFAKHAPCPEIVNAPWNGVPMASIQAVLVGTVGIDGIFQFDDDNKRFINVSLVQLKLTPLSEISDQDMLQLFQITHPTRQFLLANIKKTPTGLFYDNLNSNEQIFIDWKALSGIQHQFLINKYYAVPLFIDVNHPLNGKTAIEMGLAKSK